MRIYNNTQKDFLYLSPYTNFFVKKDGICIGSTLFSTSVFLTCTNAQAEVLLEMLRVGCKVDEVELFLKNECQHITPSEIIEDWLRKGVLE